MIPLRAFAALLFAMAFARAQNRPIIVDTDAGPDDIMAVALLLSRPNVRIEAITIVNGVAHVDAGARSMGRMLDLAGRKNVPVFAGRDRPLGGNNEFPAEWRKISDDSSGFPLPRATRRPEQMRAADYLVKRLRAGPPVKILALGPLTNIADALERDHSISQNIREIVIMGGAIRVPGNLQDGGVFHTSNNTAEWNFFIDPLAARIVLRSGIPILLVALDACNKVKIDSEFLLQFVQKPRTPLGGVVGAVLESDLELIKQGIFYAWDPLAAAALLKPSLVKAVPMHIDIKQDGPQQGRTVSIPGWPNAMVAVDADAGAFLTLFRQSFPISRVQVTFP